MKPGKVSYTKLLAFLTLNAHKTNWVIYLLLSDQLINFLVAQYMNNVQVCNKTLSAVGIFVCSFEVCDTSYTLFQNGRHLSILLFTCILALVASFKGQYSFEFRV